jgi:tRNA G10  N-methylase Trm11
MASINKIYKPLKQEKLLYLGKTKFDLRDPDEVYFAQKEFDALLGVKSEFIKTLAVLIKEKPFNLLDDHAIHLITRLTYLGEGQGLLAKIPVREIISVVKKATFLREIYIIFEVKNVDEVKSILSEIGLKVSNIKLQTEPLNINPYSQLFLKPIKGDKIIVTLRLLPFHTMFEYATEVKKLPAAVFRPKNNVNWKDYFNEKEAGIEKGINELLIHMQGGEYRSPHFGLGKNHIGDFVDWASTDLRKPFLHYLHKYKGKGDPRISRALINLLKVSEGDTILDPFAGSGAFIADAPTMGINAIGIEILNIGKTIAEVKCNLGISLPDLKRHIIKLFELIDGYEKDVLSDELQEIKTKMKSGNGSRTYENIAQHLPKILFIKNEIDSFQNIAIKKFLHILLSQQVVEFSEKKRIYDLMNTFKSYVEDRFLTLYATRKLGDILGIDFAKNKVKIIKGDSTNMSMIPDNSIDGILTSPPYFDALDYIGNNKPSILILGFDEDLMWQSTKMFYESKHRDETEYSEQLPLMVSDKYFSIQLPQSSLNLIKLLNESRRVYKSKIVENYLKMMTLSFEECYRVLKRCKYYLMVISKYHSWLIDGKEEIIDTSSILADIGKSTGFKIVDIIEHGLSKADKGKIGVEDIIVFQKR